MFFCDLVFHLPSSVIIHPTSMPPPHQPTHPPHPRVHTSASLRCRICADQCCFPARLSCSTAWMHSHQIKSALAASDLLAPPRHTPGGPSAFTGNLSFYPSFDISAPSVISAIPLSAEVPLWHKWGVSPKIPAGPHVFHHKGAQYFLIVARRPQNVHPSRQGSDLNHYFMAKNVFFLESSPSVHEL